MNKKCLVCQKEFYISPSRINKRKMCSIVCKAQSQKGKQAWNKGLKRWWKSAGEFKKGLVPWNKKGEAQQKVCLICKNEFRVTYSEIQDGRGRYCSTGCGRIGRRTNIKRDCLLCQKTFQVIPSRIKRGWGKYCSYGCSYKAQSNSKKPTSIEVKLYEELKKRGLLFERQHLINGHFLVDAYIPSLNLVIEADGDYWHSLDKTMKHDKSENAYLSKCGYGLLRLTETEINNGNFKKKLERMIN